MASGIPEIHGLEKHTLVENILRVVTVPVMNILPASLVQGTMHATSHDAGTVAKNGGSTHALEAMYSRYHRSLFSRGLFQGIADYFWHHVISQPRALRNRLKIVESLIQKEMVRLVESGQKEIAILNLGGGSSRALIHSVSHLHKKGASFSVKITTVDKDARAIALGKKIAESFSMGDVFTWVEEDARRVLGEMPKNSQHFDIIEMVGLLDYFSDHDAINLFREIYAALKPGGYFVVANVHPNQEMSFVYKTGWPKMFYRHPENMARLLKFGKFIESSFDMMLEPFSVHIIAWARK